MSRARASYHSRAIAAQGDPSPTAPCQRRPLASHASPLLGYATSGFCVLPASDLSNLETNRGGVQLIPTATTLSACSVTATQSVSISPWQTCWSSPQLKLSQAGI